MLGSSLRSRGNRESPWGLIALEIILILRYLIHVDQINLLLRSSLIMGSFVMSAVTENVFRRAFGYMQQM